MIPCLMLAFYWTHTGKDCQFILQYYLEYCLSEDPVAASESTHAGDRADDGHGMTTVIAPPICECSKCPDLALEEFSRCCRSNSKAREICFKLDISCICGSPKLKKYFDKGLNKSF